MFGATVGKICRRNLSLDAPGNKHQIMFKSIIRHPLLLLYLALSALHLLAEQQAWELVILGTKPLLMPILALWLWQQTKSVPSLVRTFLLLGLLFSCGGDTLLMFVEHGPQQEHFFLLGLGSFLLAQLCYSIALFRFPKLREGLVANHPWLGLLFMGYWYWIIKTLLPGIPGAMLIPVAVYALAIVAMAVLALNLSGRIASRVFGGFFFGVALFVLSDSLIAFNKFSEPVPYARFLIMFTYLAAQLLITWNAKPVIEAAAQKNADQPTES